MATVLFADLAPKEYFRHGGYLFFKLDEKRAMCVDTDDKYAHPFLPDDPVARETGPDCTFF